jgi:hypothetical protein
VPWRGERVQSPQEHCAKNPQPSGLARGQDRITVYVGKATDAAVDDNDR